MPRRTKIRSSGKISAALKLSAKVKHVPGTGASNVIVSLLQADAAESQWNSIDPAISRLQMKP